MTKCVSLLFVGIIFLQNTLLMLKTGDENSFPARDKNPATELELAQQHNEYMTKSGASYLSEK